MITNIKDGKTMFIILRSEIKTFNFDRVGTDDVIVVEHNLSKMSDSDYFISTRNNKVSVRKRYELKEITYNYLPYYMRDFTTEIQLRLNTFKRNEDYNSQVSDDYMAHMDIR